MNWFTENPWPPALICLAAAGLAVAWAQTRSQPRDRTLGFVGALGGVLAALAIFPLERSIVTDRERIELDVRQLVADFTAQDEDATLSHFSPGAVEWRKQVQLALKLVKVQGIDVKDLSVKLFGQGTGATSLFRANGRVTFSGMDAGHQPSRWKLTWQKEQGEWKIVDVVRLNPLKDEPMGILENRAQ
jgi:hypothetical protein